MMILWTSNINKKIKAFVSGELIPLDYSKVNKRHMVVVEKVFF